MTLIDCGSAREMIPDVAGGRLDMKAAHSVERHASSCAECHAELALARLVYASRSSAPRGLADRVVQASRRERRSFRRPWWGISAAAVAALALGIGITSSPAEDDWSPDAADMALETGEAELWLSEDGILAGAPVFEALSDEALTDLLEELTPRTTGGQA